MKSTFFSFILFIVPLIGFSKTKCIAHRGNNAHHFENSMSSIKSAVEIGSDGVEFDVVHTKDGVPLVFHDKKLERLARNKAGKICPVKTKIKKLLYMDIVDNCELNNGEDIPTLEKILSYLSDKDLLKVVEFKDHPNFVSLSLIKKYLVNPSLVRVISFKKKGLDIVARYAESDPYFLEIPLFFLYRLFYFPKKDYHYSIHFTEKGLKRLLKHRGERELGVWTVDKKEDMKLVIENGINYLTTNHPARCLKLKNIH